MNKSLAAVIISLLSIGLLTSPIQSACDDAKYLPSGYNQGMSIRFREITKFLENKGVPVADLRYLEKPGTRDKEQWLNEFSYADIDSAVILVGKRSVDTVGVICFTSPAVGLKFRKVLLAQRKHIAEKSGRELNIDENSGTITIPQEDGSFVFLKHGAVFGNSAAVETFKRNRSARKGTASARFARNKAAIFMAFRTDEIGSASALDMPDFGGLREAALGTKAVEMSLSFKGSPKLTIGLVMKNKALAYRVSALFTMSKALATGFASSIEDRPARKALTSLLNRLKVKPNGKNANLALKLNGTETAILIVLLQNAIQEGKVAHREYQNALRIDAACTKIQGNSLPDLTKIKDINLRGTNGNYLLHCAAAAGKSDLVNSLLSKGADRSLRNQQDETAYDAAFNAHHYDLASSLLPNKMSRNLHTTLISLANKDKALRISTTADGEKQVHMKSALERDEENKTLIIVLDASTEPRKEFTIPFEPENPLVHPQRTGAIYNLVFTLGSDKNETPENSAESTDSSTNADTEISVQLVSALDPEYQPSKDLPGDTESEAPATDDSATVHTEPAPSDDVSSPNETE